VQLTFNTDLCGGKPLIVKEFCISLQRVFFFNNFPLGVDFTAGGLNQLHKSSIPHSIQIHSANFLQCMNVNNECFDICNTQVSPKKKMSP
jgi:hypothetical protein